MEIKNTKTALYTSDIEQVKKYLSAKGFICADDDGGNYLYIHENTYELTKDLKNIEGYKTLNSVDFSHEIHRPIKESYGKLFYEIDWRFIQQIAERLAESKGKYPLYNWKKPMDQDSLEQIKQAVVRHFIEFVE